MEKKLYRSRRQRMIAGVCGGIAEYFDIDVTWVRLLLAISVFFGGIGIVLYILGIIVIPEDPVVDGNIDQDEGGRVYVNTGDTTSQTNRTALVIGVALIIIGLLSFIKRLIPDVWRYVRNLGWPSILIILGIAIILIPTRKK